MHDLVYKGTANDRDWQIEVHCPDGDHYRLPLYLNIVNHSPTGFAWGYGGSGPAQAAFALCYHATGLEMERAMRAYMDFKWAVLTTFGQDSDWELNQKEILSQIALIESQYTPEKQARIADSIE